MKKLLFAANNLDIGGIERALITLINELSKNPNYEITLVLDKKEGLFINDINDNIKVIEYNSYKSNNIILRKTVNLFKRIIFTLKHKNKYDFSASYATYSIMCSFVARTASKNSNLWGHADYMELYNNDKNKVINFFSSLECEKFKRIIFVSEEGKNSFVKVYPFLKDKVMVCYNLIDYNRIKKLSKEKIELGKDDIFTFINIGRHDEEQKRLSRIIEASKKLKENNYKFRVIFIGDGKDTAKYKEMANKYDLGDYIIFLGRKKNPYPYYLISDAVILTSEYEGYPVVFQESMVLNIPILTTKVSGSTSVIDNSAGIIANKDNKDIYNKMKNLINKKYSFDNKFDAKKFNENVMSKIEELI